ncbi:hypothetical protein FQN54_004286 [Arachnomyces sp. PD_36]|nr:hypothetical protein FQN54_004286 [Arachnomyces sp. PD_36]
MSYKTWPAKELISKFARSPPIETLDEKATVSSQVGYLETVAEHDDRFASPGALERLPLEIQQNVCAFLDFQSLSRLSLVSLRTRDVVTSCPEYADITKYARHAVVALRQTGLLGAHSALTLRAALRSKQCVCCGDHGVVLFLPTCERACLTCLWANPAFWVIPAEQAKRYFALAPWRIQRLPTASIAPWFYTIRTSDDPLPVKSKFSVQKKYVSVRAVKELAIQVHGSVENIEKAVACQKNLNFEILKDRFFRQIVMGSFGKLRSVILNQKHVPANYYPSIGSIPFPFFRNEGGNKTVENALWCRGCEKLFSHFQAQGLPEKLQAKLVPDGYGPYSVLSRIRFCARAREEFLEHAKSCGGVREIVDKGLPRVDTITNDWWTDLELKAYLDDQD